MKEIKILIQQLRHYPNNLFIYPKDKDLIICDKDGEEQGIIEVGGDDEVKIK